ncbi:MAG: 50S ribosomal protein L17 [Candidatus Omnitrophica bacterium]|nr:50S ribosomal protein L17 [Candidatus Omnitrophota bacterium]
MRHRKKSEKFSRPKAQRKALVKSLLRALITYERITTTTANAKALRSWADKLITLAKSDTLHHRRLSYDMLQDHALVKRLFTEIGPRYRKTPGGYTRILQVSPRKGDNAPMSLLEFTQRTKRAKPKTAKEQTKPVQEPKQKTPQEKSEEQKGFMSGMRKIFGKEKER